jgi:hypothetical protein
MGDKVGGIKVKRVCREAMGDKRYSGNNGEDIRQGVREREVKI